MEKDNSKSSYVHVRTTIQLFHFAICLDGCWLCLDFVICFIASVVYVLCTYNNCHYSRLKMVQFFSSLFFVCVALTLFFSFLLRSFTSVEIQNPRNQDLLHCNGSNIAMTTALTINIKHDYKMVSICFSLARLHFSLLFLLTFLFFFFLFLSMLSLRCVPRVS